MRIVLAAINAKWIHPSLALRLLKANLGSMENDCEILEFALRQPLKEKTDPVLAARPEILGLSVSIWNHQATLELLAALEEKWKDESAFSRGICAYAPGQEPARGLARGGEQAHSRGLPRASEQEPLTQAPEQEFPRKPVIVLGGPEVSWLPEDSEIFRHADYVIRGEGEESFRELCEALLENSRNSSDTFPPEKFINAESPDLSSVIPAYRLYTDEDVTRKLVYVEASRGCPFNCEFCQGSAGRTGADKVHGVNFVREFPPEPFLADMGSLIDRGGRIFKFLDRTFNLDIDRAIRIMEFFLERIEAAGVHTGVRTAGNMLACAGANLPADEPVTEPAARGSASAAAKTPLCVHFEMVPSRFPVKLRETIRRFPPGTLRLELGIQTLNSETAALLHIHRSGMVLHGGGGSVVCASAERADSTAGESPAALTPELEVLDFLYRETNAIVHADLIAGLPGESFDSFGAGFDKLWRVMSGGGLQAGGKVSSGSSGSGLAPNGGSDNNAGGGKGGTGAGNKTTAGGKVSPNGKIAAAGNNTSPGGTDNKAEIQLGILKCLPGTPISRHNQAHGMRYSPEAPYEVIETGALTAAGLARIKNFARFWELIVNRNPFPDLLPRLVPFGENSFETFMSLSGSLLGHFGRNWGIDRKELRLYLENLAPFA